MLRGVNKNIIEVLETENKYFEKVILFIRPDLSSDETNDLKKKADDYLSNIQAMPKEKYNGKYTNNFPMWIKLSLSCALGAVASGLFFFFF